jgi:hypothetical protein
MFVLHCIIPGQELEMEAMVLKLDGIEVIIFYNVLRNMNNF